MTQMKPPPENPGRFNRWKRPSQLGLSYEPQYVFSGDEVTRLMGGAFHVIQQAKSA